MKLAPYDQQAYILVNLDFQDSDIDYPDNFYDASSFIELFCGKSNFRGMDYTGNGEDFSESVMMSIMASGRNKKCFESIFKKIDLIELDCIKKEFYELVVIIKEIKFCYNKALKSVDIAEQELIFMHNIPHYMSDDKITVHSMKYKKNYDSRLEELRDKFKLGPSFS